jgi:hypothetical protein
VPDAANPVAVGALPSNGSDLDRRRQRIILIGLIWMVSDLLFKRVNRWTFLWAVLDR